MISKFKVTPSNNIRKTKVKTPTKQSSTSSAVGAAVEAVTTKTTTKTTIETKITSSVARRRKVVRNRSMQESNEQQEQVHYSNDSSDDSIDSNDSSKKISPRRIHKNYGSIENSKGRNTHEINRNEAHCITSSTCKHENDYCTFDSQLFDEKKVNKHKNSITSSGTSRSTTLMMRSVDEYLEAAAAAEQSTNMCNTMPSPSPSQSSCSSCLCQSHERKEWNLLKGWRYTIIFVSLGIANSADASEILCLSYVLSDPMFQQQILDPYTEYRSGLLAATVFCGMLLGGLIVGCYGDWYGRRPMLQIGLFTCSVTGFLSAMCSSVWTLSLCRFVAGLGIGATVPPLFALCSELSPPSTRGFWVSVAASFWMIGSIYVSVVGWIILGNLLSSSSASIQPQSVNPPPEIPETDYYSTTTTTNSVTMKANESMMYYDYNSYNSTNRTDEAHEALVLFGGWLVCPPWRFFTAICAIPSAIGFLLVHKFVPESPRFLLLQHRHEEALSVLHYLVVTAMAHGRFPSSQSPLPPLTLEELYYQYPVSQQTSSESTVPVAEEEMVPSPTIEAFTSPTTSSTSRNTKQQFKHRGSKQANNNEGRTNMYHSFSSDTSSSSSVRVTETSPVHTLSSSLPTVQPISRYNESSNNYTTDALTSGSAYVMSATTTTGTVAVPIRSSLSASSRRWLRQLQTMYVEFRMSSSILYTNKNLQSTTIALQIVWLSLSFGSYGLLTWINTLFERVHLKNVYFNALLFSLSNLPGNLLSAYLMDKVGRSRLLTGSILLAALSLVSFAYQASSATNVDSNNLDITDNNRTDTSSEQQESLSRTLIVASACTFQCFIIAAWNAIDVLTSELFPTSVRATGMGVCAATGRIGAMVAQFVNGWLVSNPTRLLLVSAGMLTIGSLTPMWLPEDQTGQPVQDYAITESPTPITLSATCTTNHSDRASSNNLNSKNQNLYSYIRSDSGVDGVFNTSTPYGASESHTIDDYNVCNDAEFNHNDKSALLELGSSPERLT